MDVVIWDVLKKENMKHVTIKNNQIQKFLNLFDLCTLLWDSINKTLNYFEISSIW